MSKWEQNIAHPDISLLTELSELLGVSEHELLTASVDCEARRNAESAQKWRRLSRDWNLFFSIGYGVTIVTCFIVNIAVNKTLSWFWIVLTSLLLAATFTTISQYINKHRIVIVPASEFAVLILLLFVTNLYSGGHWFWTAAIFFGLELRKKWYLFCGILK